MDKAKTKVNDFLHKSGKHDTTIHETVNPAVTHETVNRHQHEHNTTAIDREVRQDHHHTSVQPVHDQQVLPEQHHLREHDTVSRDFKHGNEHDISAKLQEERAKFRDHSTTGHTTTSHEEGPVVTGEHIHHNVHEVIQPVVNRETVEPHVVHSINKVHEHHENPAQVHQTSTLPAMNMADFRGHGGSLTGRETRTEGFAGEPHRIGGSGAHHTSDNTDTGYASGGHHSTGTTGSTGLGHTTGGHHTTGTTDRDYTTGERDTTGTSGLGHLTGDHHTTGTSGLGHTTGGHHTTGDTGIPGTGHTTGTHHTSDLGHTSGTHHTSGTDHTPGPHVTPGTGPTAGNHYADGTKKKPSLADKLNPKIDADGDGKAGFMS